MYKKVCFSSYLRENAGLDMSMTHALLSQDVFYTSSVTNLREYQSSPNMREYVTSAVVIPTVEEEPMRFRLFSCRCLPTQMRDVLLGE